MAGMTGVDSLSGYGAELEELALRRKYAQMLREQSMQPLTGAGMAGRTVAPISWTQGLAQMIKGAGGAMGEQSVARDRRGLADRATAERSSTMQQALARAKFGDKAGGAQQLSASPFTDLQGIGNQAMAPQFAPPKPMVVGRSLMDQTGNVLGSDPVYGAEKAADRQSRQEDLALRLSEMRNQQEASRQQRAQDAQANRDLRRDMASIASSNRQPREMSPPVAVIGEDGKPRYVSRQDALGMAPANLDPSTQGAVAGAKKGAQESAEIETQRPQATQAKNSIVENLTSLKTNLKELRGHKGLSGITGAVFGRTPSVMDDSMAAQAKYDNVVNNIFVNALQAMRAASKTGGAVGNVSDREGSRLEQTLAALSRAQGTKDFQGEVDKAVARLELAQKNIEDAYNQTYGRRDTDRPTLSPQEQSELDALRKRFGR